MLPAIPLGLAAGIVALAVYLAIVVVFFSAVVDVIVASVDPRLRQPGPST